MSTNEKLSQLLQLYNQAAVAKAANLSPHSVRAYAANKTRPSIDATKSLARVLGVDWAWLLDDEQAWPPVRVPEGTRCHVTSAA